MRRIRKVEERDREGREREREAGKGHEREDGVSSSGGPMEKLFSLKYRKSF